MYLIKLKNIFYLFVLLCLVSLFLILADEWEAVGAFWIMIVCLLPAMWMALRTSYLSIKIFCATVLITQIITVPLFYLRPDRYLFDEHRPFSFTAVDALPIYLHLGIFLFLVATVLKVSQRLIGRPAQWTASRTISNASGAMIAGRVRRQTMYVIAIFLLMLISLPVKFWMFDMGVGIVGAPPPRLPFRFSGILTYLFGYIIPLAIGYFYIKSKRNSLLLVLIISAYALLIGVSSSSKGIMLLTMAPIIAFAWFDRRWTILSLSGLMTGFGVLVVAASRQIVHISDGLTTGSFTELGTLGTLVKTFALLEWSPEMLFIFADITDRVEGFQGLLLASQFNSDAVGGAWNLFIKTINNGWISLDHDAMHLEYIGYTIPLGFYNIASSFNDWMFMATNKNPLMVLPFVAYAALTLIILERMIMRAAYKYRLSLHLAQAIVFLTTMWFYTAPGSREFLTLLLVSIIFGVLPAIRLGNTLRLREL